MSKLRKFEARPSDEVQCAFGFKTHVLLVRLLDDEVTLHCITLRCQMEPTAGNVFQISDGFQHRGGGTFFRSSNFAVVRGTAWWM